MEASQQALGLISRIQHVPAPAYLHAGKRCMAVRAERARMRTACFRLACSTFVLPISVLHLFADCADATMQAEQAAAQRAKQLQDYAHALEDDDL